MNLTRPTSSKGRSRAAVSSPPYGGDADGVQKPPDRSLRSGSRSATWESRSQQENSAGPLQTLNKYKVLPSIERRRPDTSPPGRRSLDERMSELHLSGDDAAASLQPDPDQRRDAGSKSTGAGGSLLLAVRAPCGRRFQQVFESTDPLRTVRASAEARYGTKYGEVSIETMDVPRRTFTDLDLTLAQSGISNRSVLFISQKDSESL